MEEFDVYMNMNGVQNELNHNFIGTLKSEVAVSKVAVSKVVDRATETKNTNPSIAKSERERKNRFDGETEIVPEENKKSWTDTLNDLTKTFKDVTGYKTNEQVQAEREKELAEKGVKYKVLGMNPFVAVTISLVVIIGGSYAITKIKAG
jgi:hypothetical protein